MRAERRHQRAALIAFGMALACGVPAAADAPRPGFDGAGVRVAFQAPIIPPTDGSEAPAQPQSQDTILEKLRARADRLLAEGRNREALAELDAILQARPDDAITLIDRGLARWRSLDIRIAPAGLDGFALLQREMCRGKIDCPDVALALSDLGRAIALLAGPDRAVPLTYRARVFADSGQIRLALADCDEAVRLSPGELPFRIVRAQVRQQAGDAAGARADFDEALRLRPHDAQTLVERARMLQQSGDLDGARADLDDALRQRSTGDPAWLGQARNLRQAMARPDDPGMEPELADLAISGVGLARDLSGEEVVTVTLTPEAAHRFADFTTAHLGAGTEVLVDGKVVAAPRILSPILGGSLQIAGAFSHDDAKSLAAQLGAGGAAMTVRVAR